MVSPSFYILNYYFLFFLLLSDKVKYFLRSLILVGVISTNSSSLINSKASSKLNIIGLFKRIASSLLDERIFVNFLFLQGFTVKSIFLLHIPIIIPSYTFVPGFIIIVPRLLKLKRE